MNESYATEIEDHVRKKQKMKGKGEGEGEGGGGCREVERKMREQVKKD